MAEEENKNAKIDTEKQEKLKQKTEREKQDDKIKAASPEELREMLSNKNSDYVFRLQKELEKQGNMSYAESEAKINELLPEIVIAQKHGQPANGLYMASPQVKANEIIHPHVEPKTIMDFPFWQRAVDNGLLWLAIFMALYGFLGMFNTQNTEGQNGVLTITTVGVLLGVFMAKYNEWIIPKGQRKISWGRVILTTLILVVGLFVWMMILSLPVLRIINPVLPGIAYLVIAAAAYGIRYWFRKKYGITGSAFGPQPVSRK